jgi:predicted dehydrogenase
MAKARIAFIGCGGVTELHAAAYLAHSDRIRVVAACDPVVDRASVLAQRFVGCKAFSGLTDAIQGSDWDVGVVCSPTPVRVPVVKELAAAGKHVFVEKPFADNIIDARAMVATCEENGVKIAVHQNFRYHYPFELARQAISSGDIGNVHTVLHRDLMFRQDAGWRTTTARHALAVMGIHWLDGFRWMLDDEASSVSAYLSSSPLIEATGDTEATVALQFRRGSTVSYMESFSYPERDLETIVIGDTGSLRLRQSELTEWIAAPAQGRPSATTHANPEGSNKPEATFRSIEELLKAIEGDYEPSNSGQDNIKTVELLEAAYQSASSGNVISLAAGGQG